MILGDMLSLHAGDFEVGECKKCRTVMVNVDADELYPGDLEKIRNEGLRISNPETDEMLCLNCDIETRPSRRVALRSWFDTPSSSPSYKSSDSGWFGGSSGGGFSFGGFGGGGFSGGGASGGF